MSSAFGTPTSNLPTATVAPSGFISTGIGTPTGSQGYTASTVIAYEYNDSAFTRFGTPSHVLNHVVSGFSSTWFGTATAYANSFTVSPTGFRSTLFGSPTGSRRIAGVVSGFNSTAFGQPISKYTQVGFATGFYSARFGKPAGPMFRKIPAVYSLNKPDVTYVLRKL